MHSTDHYPIALQAAAGDPAATEAAHIVARMHAIGARSAEIMATWQALEAEQLALTAEFATLCDRLGRVAGGVVNAPEGRQ